jgi:predicted phosphodiesterase
MERLTGLAALTVRGNHDRWLDALDPATMGPSDRFAYREITAEQLKRLGALPFELVVAPGIVAFHATPSDDNTYLLDAVENGRLVRDRHWQIAERLGAVDKGTRLVLCGHSHRADIVQLPGGPIVLNPGSVGYPAYQDGSYVSESGLPHARCALVDTSADGQFAMELIAIPYDHERAARRAEQNGRPEVAHGLRTGFMPQLA